MRLHGAGVTGATALGAVAGGVVGWVGLGRGLGWVWKAALFIAKGGRA